jgi:beta-lactam-binding protein with PASTA domain
LLFLLARTLGVGGANEVVVPGVVGDTQAVAQEKLQDEGLKVAVRSEPNDANPPGQVLRQDPTAGARVKRGSTVSITVSGAAEAVVVPNVVGRQRDEAIDMLEAAGFTAQVRTRPDDRAPQNEVVDQAPKANDRAPRGSVVNLIVSSGPEQVVIPPLANVPEAEAANQLRQAGLEVSRTTQADASVQSGRVIRTDPAAGTSVEKGSTVQLIVSSGAPATTAPPATAPPTTSPPATVATTTTRPPATTSTTI